MSIEIIKADITELEVDAIVNAANKYLMPGLVICGAIYKKAGLEDLNSACAKIKTPLNDGDAVITPAFNITNTKFIIHAVGPDFRINKDSFDKLENAYYNSLVLLKENNLKSIAFPLISSGIFAGNLKDPAKESAICLINAFERFNNEFDYNVDVILCAFTRKEYESIKDLFN